MYSLLLRSERCLGRHPAGSVDKILPISLWCKYAMANKFCGIVFNFKFGNKIKYIQILNTVVVSNKQHVPVLFLPLYGNASTLPGDRRP